MNADVKRRGPGARREDVEAWKLAFYGGVAGEVLWLSSYPFDVIKSKMQTDGIVSSRHGAPAGQAARQSEAASALDTYLGKQRYASMRACFAQTFREEGLVGFWKGIGPTLLRAMPVSAATFLVAEVTLRLIS